MYNPAWRLRSYSHQGQDIFVRDLLGGLRGGFFLDSGAGNGLTGSNTKLLEEAYGWNGICVEPSDREFARLRANRRCLCFHGCLYSRESDVPFLEGAGPLGGIVEAYPPTALERAREVAASANPGEPARVVERAARLPLTLLTQARAPEVIDYWSLDTEGSELAILECFPFDRYRVRVLTVEHNDGPAREPIHTFLRGQGYQRVAELGIDDGYLLRDALR